LANKNNNHAILEIKTKLRLLLMKYINVIIIVLLGISLYLLYNYESQKTTPLVESKRPD